MLWETVSLFLNVFDNLIFLFCLYKRVWRHITDECVLGEFRVNMNR